MVLSLDAYVSRCALPLSAGGHMTPLVWALLHMKQNHHDNQPINNVRTVGHLLLIAATFSQRHIDVALERVSHDHKCR